MRVLMLTNDCEMIDRRILQEAQTLRAAGHRVTLLAGFECKEPSAFTHQGIPVERFTYDWDDERLKKIRARLPAKPWLIQYVNTKFMAVAKRWFRVSPFERFILEQAYRHPADVVHVHDYPMLHPGVQLARRWGVPLVYDAHEIFHAQDMLPAEVQKQYRERERRLMPSVDAMITINEFCAAQFAQMHRMSPPTVIHNAADETTLPTDPRTPTLKERLGVAGPVILFQGWLSAERNIGTVIEAMVHVPRPAVLAVIGYGAHLPALRELTQRLNLTERVFFTGAVPAEEMLSYTCGADLGVIPYLPIDDNHRFCSPNKFFEFGVAGVPILAHELPFFQAMRQRHGVVACTDFTSAAAVGKTINHLMASGELARMKAACAKSYEMFTWTYEGKKLLKIYERFQPRKKQVA